MSLAEENKKVADEVLEVWGQGIKCEMESWIMKELM